MEQTPEESRGWEENRTSAGVHGRRGEVEMVRKPEQMDKRETVDSPVLPGFEARAVGRLIPGDGRVFFGENNMVNMVSQKKRRTGQ